MIDIKNILKRSWKILWSYKVLWIFGILLALTMGGGNSGSSNSGWRNQASQNASGGFANMFPERTISENAPEWVQQLVDWFVKDVEPLFLNPEQHIGTFIAIGVILLLVVLIFSVIAAFVRYPAETAVMRMVDGYETDGTKLGFKQGWKLGWNRRAFRLWLIDLILSLPVVLIISIMIGVGLAILMPRFGTSSTPGTGAIVSAIGLGFLLLILVIVAAVFLTVVRNFFARAAALDGLTLGESFKSGWSIFKRNWKSAGLVLLVMIGIGIAVGIAGLILFFLLIPAYIILLIPAALAASLPALLAYGIAGIFTSGPLTWVIAVIAALPVFFTVLFAPLMLFSGWYKIFQSNVWTLTYREIKAKENLAAPTLPAEGIAKIGK
jgi:hypothetical protein